MAARSTLTVTSGTTITSAWGNSVRDHLVTYTTSADGTTEGMLSVDTSANKLRIGNGSTTVQFGTYGTPDGWSVSAVVQSSPMNVTLTDDRLTRYGHHIVASGVVTIDSGFGTSGNAVEVQTDLPVSDDASLPIGTFRYRDSTTNYIGAVIMPASGELSFVCHNSTGLLGVSPAFAGAAGDTILINLNYFTTSAT